MRRRIGWVVAIAGLLVCALIIGFLLSTSRHTGEQAQPVATRAPDTVQRARLQVDDLELKDFDAANKLRWRVRSAGSVDMDREAMVARAREVQWELTRADGAHLLLTAPEFVADYPARKLTFTRGVKAESTQERLSFQADRVMYNMTTDRLRAEGLRASRYGEFSIRAQALGVARLERRATFIGDVRLEARDYVCSADKAVVDGPAHRAWLTGKPTVRRGDYFGQADRIDVDAARHEARLTGNVQVRREGLLARARQAFLRQEPQRAELTEAVVLSGRGFTATGRKLVVDGATSTATLSGAVHLRLSLAR